MLVLTRSVEETRELGAALGRTALPGDVLWLRGELGAGKTEMTRGVAAGLRCDSTVSSPSFALIHEYAGCRLPLYHVDLYRLSELEALELALEEYLEGEGVTVVEWAERLPRGAHPDGLEVDLAQADPGDERRILLRPRGLAGGAWLARLLMLLRPR